MDQRADFVLFVGFNCNTQNVPVGTAMRIDSDLTVAPVTQVNDPNYLGRIISNYWNENSYVCSTKHLHRYDQAVAGVSGMTVGPGVHGPNNMIFPFKAPVAASCAGTVAGPYTITTGTDDVLSVQVNSTAAQTFTLVSSDLPTLVATVNATAVGFVCYATAAGTLGISAINVADTITIGAPTHTCNAVLGLTAAAYTPTAGTDGSPTCLIINTNGSGAAGTLIEILED